jgi:hypothetical protein
MRLTLITLALLVSFADLASAASVRGYTRRDGTYVQPHERSAPNSTIRDNYTYPGNYNPNTGRITGGDPFKRDRDQDGIPDAIDTTPYGTRSRNPFGVK